MDIVEFAEKASIEMGKIRKLHETWKTAHDDFEIFLVSVFGFGVNKKDSFAGIPNLEFNCGEFVIKTKVEKPIYRCGIIPITISSSIWSLKIEINKNGSIHVYRNSNDIYPILFEKEDFLEKLLTLFTLG